MNSYQDKLISIHKKLTNQSTKEDLDDFNKMIENDPENISLVQDVTTILKGSKSLDHDVFDADAAYNRFVEKVVRAENDSKINSPTTETTEPRKEPYTPKVLKLNWKNFAAAASILLIGSFFIFKLTDQQTISISEQYTSIEAKNNSKYTSEFVKLEDGSTVWLTDGSTLTVGKFNDKIRDVSITGKGYFEIAKNENAPFNIFSEKFAVTVLGTRFVVDTKMSKVSVKDGKVKVKNDNSTVELVSNQSSVLADDENLQLIEEDFKSSNTDINDNLSFDNTPLDKVIEDISKYFKVKLILSSSREWSNCTFTSGSLRNNTLEDVLTLLKFTFDCEFTTLQDKSIKVSAVKCK